jgi:outer membrane protein OmpA-like peptidoglycan-associated protein
MPPEKTPSTRRRVKRGGSEASKDDAARLALLRRALVGPEQGRIAELEKQPSISADTVGSVLPGAISQSHAERGQELAIALEPVTTDSVRAVARRNPELFGEILAPTIGAAVRTAVRDAIKEILARFDAVLERSISIQSLRWRIEARRAGCPFGEVVLKHTLVYRIEQVFLIQPTTGVLLQHALDEGAVAQDPDQVASMLEAINSFVREAFRPQPSGVDLSYMEVGDLTVWVNRDPRLIVAAVVRGAAPRTLAEMLREVRERLLLTYRSEVQDLPADVSAFAGAREILESALHSEQRPPRSRARIWLAAFAALVVLAVGGLIYRADQRADQMDAYVQTLQEAPGIVVTSASRANGRIQIEGFRDPVAPPPREVLEQQGLSPPRLVFTQFVSLEPQIVEERARRQLTPPQDVTLTFHDGTLTASGTAPRDWIEQARGLSRVLPGVERFDTRALRSEEAMAEEALDAAIEILEAQDVPFSAGSAVPRDIAPVTAHVHNVLAAARAARVPVCVTLVGHTDPLGSVRGTQRLSEARATAVAQALRGAGIPSENLRELGAGAWYGAASHEQARIVTVEAQTGTSCEEL